MLEYDAIYAEYDEYMLTKAVVGLSAFFVIAGTFLRKILDFR